MIPRRYPVISAVLLCGCLLAPADGVQAQDRVNDEPFIFAVITTPPKDPRAVTAHVLFDGTVREAKLFPDETVVGNPVWRTLEFCHSLRAEVRKVAEGFQIITVRALDAGMLPMSLQSIAGDCLIKKAIEVAPLVD